MNTEFNDLGTGLDEKKVGECLYELIRDLYPICRSITGNGVRETLRRLQTLVPLKIHEVPTGTKVFDWTVPKEWNIQDAYIKNAKGEKIVDFQQSNLHVVSYSQPVKAKLHLKALKEHLFTLPDHPDWVPYRTSYYKESWGFCLSHKQFLELKEGEYEVCIESSLENGHLTYGQYYLPGKSSDEILISCHICHPSLCNDNLSGMAVATWLAKSLSQHDLRYSYRFLFIPGTIGSITWLSYNQANVFRIKHGLVLTGLGDRGRCTYKKSRRGNAEIDRAMIHVLKHSGDEHEVIDFFPYGYDERQYCSPGFDLPVGCLMRSRHGRYDEYHTSADNLGFVDPRYLADSLDKCLSALYILENNATLINQNPHCEPQLGRRGLYRAVGGHADGASHELTVLWVLNLSDGQHSLLDIADRSGLGFELVKTAADTLEERGLLKDGSPYGRTEL